jgi:hypothetical protein
VLQPITNHMSRAELNRVQIRLIARGFSIVESRA